MPLDDQDPPRYVIVSARVSPMAELARWLFERYRIPYEEEAHAPLVHALFTWWRKGGVEVPVVISAASVWTGAREVLDGLDGRLRAGERLYGDSPVEREANQRLVGELLNRLVLTVRRLAYFHLLPIKALVYPVVTDGVPWWERGLVWLFYPVWRWLLARALDSSPSALAAAPQQILEAFDLVEEELDKRGTRFFGGAQPNAIDIIFAALVAPLTVPPNYGSRLPALASLPPELKTFVESLRARSGGQLALKTYEIARPTPQPPLRRRWRDRTLAQRLLGPGVQRLGARIAVFIDRPLIFRKLAIASRWQDVRQVLELDLLFVVKPVNGPRFDVISGPFVLGLDRGEQFVRERARMYDAIGRVDVEDVRRCVAQEATRLLDTALAEGSRLDVAHGYAHLVAARTALHVFGIPGPTEADLMRVCRALFHYGFLDQSGDEAVKARATRAAAEMRAWVSDEIARRRRAGLAIDDVLGRLMTTRAVPDGPLDDDAVRRNLVGLLVGAIDTTSTTVPRIIYVLGGEPKRLARVERDVDDPLRMRGWCAEALRMWPSAPVLFRRASGPASLRGRAVRPGSLVAAFTQAAMFDPDVFPQPTELDPSRPQAHYFNFGGGLHPCAGRGINDVQLPELVARVVSRGIASVEPPRFVGPFLDELVVNFRRAQP